MEYFDVKPLYFDYNATTPVLARVFEAMRPFLTERFGNPGSGHMWGLRAAQAVARARAQVASLLGASPDEIYFTSCATESNNQVLFGLFQGEGHLVTTAVEHPAVLEPAGVLEKRGVKVTRVPVDAQGLVSPDDVLAALTDETRLISVMLANNETGAIQPVAEIAARARERGVLVHTDAAQAVGKIGVDVAELGVDLLSVAGHKLYAPKGVGALYVRRGVRVPPLLHGGGQERGLRSGTENVPHLVGLGEACALAAEALSHEAERRQGLGRVFLEGLRGLGFSFRLHSAEAPRLPNTMSVGFEGLSAGDVLSGLVGWDVGASAGAACHGDVTAVSHVLEAMNVPTKFAAGTIRFSWGRLTSED
ncbi:MAG: cysteine desulfurase, partial [Proteobacteria bacterium]|nr:cysteine desulfurase [Pseudomonadota bacterium]